MDPTGIIGAGISAGASLIGGKMAADSSAKAARLNAMAQAAADERNREYNERVQKEFAQNSVRWKVEDARAAGIHPAFALGAPTQSFSTHVGQQISPFVGSSMGSSLASAGQDIGRAVAATSIQEQKDDAYTASLKQLNLQKAGLENALLASQINRLSQTSMPAFPNVARERMIPGQGNTPNSGRYKMKPMESEYGAKTNAVVEPMHLTDVGYLQTRNTPSGSFMPVPSKLAKERIEDDFLAQLDHMMRNRLLPIAGFNFNPPAHKTLRPGQKWSMHPFYGYQPVRDYEKNLDGSPAPKRSLFRRSK